MGILDGLSKLGKAALGTALLPVDVVRDAIPTEGSFADGGESKTANRLEKIADNLTEGLDEIDE